MKLVSHPNVIRLESVHEDQVSISIVMTLCRGGDLWDKVNSQHPKGFGEDQARAVMKPLIKAISYLHQLGILHRDLKPENVLLTEPDPGRDLGQVKVADFGFSRQVATQAGLACGKKLIGTPSYMAPESIIDGVYGKEVDWFACGCIMYMMLMGCPPFMGRNASEILENTCAGRLSVDYSTRSAWSRLSTGARDLMVGLMRLDCTARYTGEKALEHPWMSGA
ncbi:unnamed protein product [Discosporangium mesarthrocarpum]